MTAVASAYLPFDFAVDLTINGAARTFTGTSERKVSADVTHPSTLNSMSTNTSTYRVANLDASHTIGNWRYRLKALATTGSTAAGVQHRSPNRLALQLWVHNQFDPMDYRHVVQQFTYTVEGAAFNFGNVAMSGGSVTQEAGALYSIEGFQGPYAQPNVTIASATIVDATNGNLSLAVTLNRFGWPTASGLFSEANV